MDTPHDAQPVTVTLKLPRLVLESLAERARTTHSTIDAVAGKLLAEALLHGMSAASVAAKARWQGVSVAKRKAHGKAMAAARWGKK